MLPPPDFMSKVKELTSRIEDQFLPLLEGNSGIAFPMPEVNSTLYKCKMMNSGTEELKKKFCLKCQLYS